MEADLTLEEFSSTIKSKGMKDTAPGPDGIPYSVYNKLWEQAGSLNLLCHNCREWLFCSKNCAFVAIFGLKWPHA